MLMASRLTVEASGSTEPEGIDLPRLFKDAEQCVRANHCVVCQIAQAPQGNSELEEHHIAGKIRGDPNFPDTVTICGHCHEYLSDHQKAWLLCCKAEAARLSCYFFGWADIFDLLYKLSGASGFEKLAEKFRCQGYYIRNALGERRLVP